MEEVYQFLGWLSMPSVKGVVRASGPTAGQGNHLRKGRGASDFMGASSQVTAIREPASRGLAEVGTGFQSLDQLLMLLLVVCVGRKNAFNCSRAWRKLATRFRQRAGHGSGGSEMAPGQGGREQKRAAPKDGPWRGCCRLGAQPHFQFLATISARSTTRWL